MKRLLLLLLAMAPLLCGCGDLYAQRREVEQLLVMETLGLDPAPGGVVLSLASSSGVGGEGAACYSAAGASVSDAMERLRSRSLEEELFCGHLQHILIGQKAAEEGLEGFLAFVCRSSDLRLDMPVYIVLDADTREAMGAAGDGDKGVADALSAVEAAQGTAPLSTAGALLRDLERQGSTLVRTLRLQESSETEGESRTLAPEGFGVLIGGRLEACIGPEDAVAVSLLTDTLQPCPLVLKDAQGQAVTLELEESSSQLRPVWGEDGVLQGLDLTVTLRATVLEIDGFQPVADPDALDALTAGLETEISRRLGRVLRLSRSLEADFLGLGPRIEQLAPRLGRGLDRGLGPLLPGLELSVSVQGELSHSNDIN